MNNVQCIMLLTLSNFHAMALSIVHYALSIVSSLSIVHILSNIIHYSLFIIHLFYLGHLARRIAPKSLVAWLLVCFLLFTGSVVFTGFVLSALYLTANSWVWGVAVFLTSTALGWVLQKLVVLGNLKPGSGVAPHPHSFSAETNFFSIRQLIQTRWRDSGRWFTGLAPFQKFIFGTMLITLAVVAITNLLIVLFTVPNEWDSMTGHLNRVVQYIQRGSMRHFGGTNWNIDTYPKSVCTIQIYSFLMTGRFENGFKLIHHLSYWTAIVAVFGIVQRITNSARLGWFTAQNQMSAAFFCALVYALLPDFLMQAITTETDIVLTAYLSVLLYMLFSFYDTKDSRYLWLAGMAFGLAFGHKITFVLLLPSVFVVMVYTVFWSNSVKITFARTWKLGVAIAVAMCLWTFPTGYLKNIEVFGHPIGPPTALKHQSVERAGTFKNLLIQGSRNFIRYGYDHANLDGIRSTETGVALNKAIRTPLVVLEDKLNLRLDEVTEFSIQPFSFDRRFIFYNANPYWGIFGFGLILPFAVLLLVFLLRSAPHFVLALALVLHFMALSFSAPYDPFKGRYFIETGLFGAPLLALLFSNQSGRVRWVSVALPGRLLWKTYVGLVVIVGCTSAVMTVFLNTRALPFAWRGPNGTLYPSAFETSRMKMLTIGRPDTYKAYRRFDELVPANATVALGTINDDYEYPLYGANLSRRLIAINPFERGVQPIPKEADYLFFSKNVIKPKPGDLRLGTDTTMTEGVVVPGEDYYLRKLK
jgi:Dolichyl-phosphate-mannose-protein mannosyltransferase